MEDSNNGNGNGKARVSWWQKWPAIIGAITLAFLAGTVVWKAGGTDASTDGRITRLETEVNKVEADYERKDVVEVRLKSIDDTLTKIEEQQKQQTDILLNRRH